MGPPSARSFLRSRLTVKLRLSGLPPTRSYASLDTEARGDAQLHDPTPSELFRAALTASNETSAGNEWLSTLHKQTTEFLDREWKFNSPPPALWCALRGVHPMYRTEDTRRLRSAADLPTVRHAAEKLAIDEHGAVKLQGRHCETLRQSLRRCERHSTYTQILSTMSDIIARLQRLELLIRPQLFELAMYYAALDLSPYALRQLLQGYGKLASSQRNSGTGGLVLRALLQAIDSALFENPGYDTSRVLAELTGEGEREPQNRSTLHDTLLKSPDRDRKNWSVYLCILARLQSRKPLETLWKQYLEAQNNRHEDTYHSAYNVILALIQAKRSDTAVRFLEDISRRNKDTLPYVASLRNLQPVLDDPVVGEALPDLVQGNHYEQLLGSRLNNIERRLGIEWQDSGTPEEHGAHFSIASGASWAVFKDQPLFTIDGNSAGYDDPARLYPELQARGCSKSVGDLGQLVHLLNDQGGNVQGVALNIDFDRERLNGIRAEYPSLELRWCPEHSPIEFSDSALPAMSIESQEWTPASLGLIRARSMINGVPQGGTKCLHLLQLGSMDMRLSSSEPWQPSGYVVTWDRQHGEMIALFVGRNYGLVDRGPTPSGSPFGAVAHIRPSTMPDAFPLSCDRLPRDSLEPYYLDLDPSADLGFR